jgi:excisionase family DNA binding protein
MALSAAARYLGIAQGTLRKWADAGEVPVYTTPGGHRRFRRSDLDGFLDRSRGQTSGRPRVLVLDVDATARALLRARLQAHGCVVDEAASAEEGMRLIERRPPRLLLLNVRMRRAEGWEMLRRMGEGGNGIPVLTFSGREGSRQEQRGRPAQAGSFDPERLIERARRLLAP